MGLGLLVTDTLVPWDITINWDVGLSSVVPGSVIVLLLFAFSIPIEALYALYYLLALERE